MTAEAIANDTSASVHRRNPRYATDARAAYLYQATYANAAAAARRRSAKSSQSAAVSVVSTITSNSRWMYAWMSGKKRNVLARRGTVTGAVVSMAVARRKTQN